MSINFGGIALTWETPKEVEDVDKNEVALINGVRYRRGDFLTHRKFVDAVTAAITSSEVLKQDIQRQIAALQAQLR
jgi:hypothetical protein